MLQTGSSSATLDCDVASSDFWDASAAGSSLLWSLDSCNDVTVYSGNLHNNTLKTLSCECFTPKQCNFISNMTDNMKISNANCYGHMLPKKNAV